MSRHGSEVCVHAQLCHTPVPLCKQREYTQIIATNGGATAGTPQGWCKGRGKLGMWTLMRNTKHKALVQAQRVKPTLSALHLFFLNYTCTKRYDLFATQDQTGGNASPENGAALCGSHCFKSAFPEPRASVAPWQHRDCKEKSKAGYSELTGMHEEGTAVGFENSHF